MDALFYLAGLAAGVILFLYFFSLYESGKERITKARRGGEAGAPKTAERIEPDEVSVKSAQSFPRRRICPLCGAALARFEALYAAKMKTADGEKIMIYGCRYCYRPDEDPEAKKKSEF